MGLIEMADTRREYRIFSNCPNGLPSRMEGRFTYADAYRLCCDWNYWHAAEDMAFPEKIDDSVAYPENA
jgi:hypothetical protein